MGGGVDWNRGDQIPPGSKEISQKVVGTMQTKMIVPVLYSYVAY